LKSRQGMSRAVEVQADLAGHIPLTAGMVRGMRGMRRVRRMLSNHNPIRSFADGESK
jgi:hypothetical protein